MPGCWPTVVRRSAGVTRVAMVRMIRAGTIRRVSTWSPDPLRFPRFNLIDGPSPLAPLPRFSAALGGRVEVWIKREDLLPLAFGGNKLRNLEFLVGAALAEDADCLVTSGRRWSNHARLTAAAGARPGWRFTSCCPARRSTRQSGRPTRRTIGATVHQAATDDRAERAAIVERVVAELRAEGRRPYIVASAATGIVGAVGQVLAGLEVPRARRASVSSRTVVVPSATGGTQAGLLVGLRTAGLRPTSTGSPSRRRSRLRPAIAAIAAELGLLDGLAAVGDREIVLEAPSSATVTVGQPMRPTTRPACWHGPRGSSSIRSIRPRPWPASSPWPVTGPRRPAGRVLARRRVTRTVRAARSLSVCAATPRPTATRRAA